MSIVRLIFLSLLLAFIFNPDLSYSSNSSPDCQLGTTHRIDVINFPNELQDHLNRATPGTKLLLPSGIYAGNYVYKTDASVGNEVMILPAAGAKVVFTGSFAFTGSYGVLAAVTFNNASSIVMNGHHNRFARNLVIGTLMHSDASQVSYANRIDNNEFRNQKGQVIQINAGDNAAQHQGFSIDHNYFHDHTRKPGVTQLDGEEETIELWTDADDDLKATVDSNLFDNVLLGVGGQNEIISVKTSGNTVTNNTFINSKGGTISLRQSNHSFVSDNYFGPGLGGVSVNGEDNIVRRNYVADGVIKVNAGDGYTQDRQCHSGRFVHIPSRMESNVCVGIHAASKRTKVYNNIASIIIGNVMGPQYNKPSEATDLANNNGTIAYKLTKGDTNRLGKPTIVPQPLTPLLMKFGPLSISQACLKNDDWL